MKLAIRIKNLNNHLDYSYNDKVNGFINKMIKNTKSDNHNSNKIGKYTFFLDLNSDKKIKFNKNGIYIPNASNIVLYISSSDKNFISELNNTIKINSIEKFGNFVFIIKDIQTMDIDYLDKNIFHLSLLNPIIVKDKFNKCLSPDDRDYIEYLKRNIERKIDLPLNDDIFSLNILKEKGIKKKINTVKGGKYTGYIYDFFIALRNIPNEKIYRVLEDGFGALNSQGFGFVEIKRSN